MAESVAERTASRGGIVGQPWSSLLLPVPIICFIGALITDLAYDSSGGNLQWLNFSSWLLAAGLMFGAIVTMLMVIDFIRLPQLRSSEGWAGFALLLAACAVELINSL